MVNIKLTVAYDGTHYLGWQKTQEGASIETALQSVLKQILQEEINLQAASRTDAGVHADGQVINFTSSKSFIDLARLQHSLNSLLPSDIVVRLAEEVSPNFHPTLDCLSKEYHYWICNDRYQMPQQRLYSWHIPLLLECSLMQKAANFLIGQHDFSAFCNMKKNEAYASHVRKVLQIDVCPQPHQRIQIIVKGNHFLYKMVRNIVGTLAAVGENKMAADHVLTILKSLDRTMAGPTAPAHGLSLYHILFTK